MTAQHDDQATTTPPPAAQSGMRIAFERLRERTDELELLVSGLTVFALFAAPSRIADLAAAIEPHLGERGLPVLAVVAGVLMGLCWTLGGMFVLHLGIRAHWIGLIGLKSVFPDGIRWDRVRDIGPIMREEYRRTLPDLGAAIDRSDRLASIVFALAALVTLLMLWVTALLALVGLAAMVVGPFAGEGTVGLVFAVVMAVSGGLIWLLDWGLAARSARLRASPRFARLVRGLSRVAGWFVPMRLIAPVQYTLQSNLGPRWFLALLGVLAALVPVLGFTGLDLDRRFARFGDYPHFAEDAADAGLRSAHYESMRGDGDRRLLYPMIPADIVESPVLRLFLPHRPARDNALLAEGCATGGGAAAGVDVDARCHATLWSATLDGEAVPLDGFMLAERRDLGLRGLQGYLPLSTLAPGAHVLEVTWHPRGPVEDEAREDRRRTRVAYRIPFWYQPEDR